MVSEVLPTLNEKLDQILTYVYDSGFAAGVASVPAGGGFTQEQLDAAVAEGKLAVKAAVKAKLLELDTAQDQQVVDAIDQL